MIRSHRNRPGVTAPQTALPLHMASLGNEPKPNDHVATLTTLQVAERCDECSWPNICQKDNTCWTAEKQQPWERSKADLRTVTAIQWDRDKLIQWVHDFVEEHGHVPYVWGLISAPETGTPSGPTITRNGFKNLNALVIAAGYEPHKKRRGKLR